MKESLNISFCKKGVEIALSLEVYPIPKIVTPQGTFPMSHSVLDENEVDNLSLYWKVKRRMLPTSSKRKEKKTGEIVPKKSPYLTRGTIKKLMSNAMKESKVCTSMGRRLWKANVLEDLVPEADVVDLSQDVMRTKNQVVLHQ